MFGRNKKPEIKGTEANLVTIRTYLERMDRRDRMRTWGGFIRGLISFVSAAVVIVAAWYFYEHREELMESVAKIAAEQAAKVTEQSAGALIQNMDSDAIMKEVQKYLGQ